MPMSELWYDAEEDILGVQVSKKDYWKSVEIAPNVVVDLSKSGEITGFEILKASESFGKEEMPRVISAAKKRGK
jgi:uncharacterized protein YuzE